MSTCTAELVARAVAAELQAAAYQGLTYTFNDCLDIDLKDLDEANATIRDLDDQWIFASRGKTQHDYFIEVCLRRQVASDTDVQIKTLKYSLEQIDKYYRNRVIAGRYERLNRVEQRRIVDDEQLKKLRIVKASFILIFRGWQEL